MSGAGGALPGTAGGAREAGAFGWMGAEIVGAFGNVRVGWQKSNKSVKYAIKTMKKMEIIKSKHVDHIENEKLILEKLSHPFTVSGGLLIVQLEYYGFMQDDRFVYFITELLRGGDLFTYHRSIGNFPSKQTT